MKNVESNLLCKFIFAQHFTVQHIEFFHNDHFQIRYHRKKPKKSLAQFIDFFWETDFNELYDKYPNGFSDALFPNVGYTYLINLGTPFIMQLEDASFEMKSDGFLPRHKNMICHHYAGNKIFGIKFRISPVLFEKKINFSEYKEYIFPLAYLIDRTIIEKIKKADSFENRVAIATAYYEGIISKYAGSKKQVNIVTQILKEYEDQNLYTTPVEQFATKYEISERTLQRYFEATTSISAKHALQILRIRKALETIIYFPSEFNCLDFGYYDYSHFYRHLKQFIGSHSILPLKPLLKLLKSHQQK